MLTPVDVQNKVFKGGIGFDKKEVEAFMGELSSDYAELYRSNVELKDKVATLNESLQHYRSIEESVQKSLTISEKAAEETINAAQDKARQIHIEAEMKAEAILADAKAELEQTQAEIFRLQNQHQQFVSQFKKILSAQLQLCDGEVVDIDLGEGFDSERFMGGGFSGLGSEGGLGGGGGYTGSYDNQDRAAGEPSASVGSLNFDPFSEAKNGGRFSSKTSQKVSGNKNNESGKISLNMKAEQSSNVKIKRNIPNANRESEPVAPAPEKVTKPTQPVVKEDTPKTKPEKKAVSMKEEKQKKAMEEQQAKAEAARLEEKRLAQEKAKALEEERKQREKAEEEARQKAMEDAKNEELAKERYDKELEATINAVREAAQKGSEPTPPTPKHFSVHPTPKQEAETTPVKEEFEESTVEVTGEVEDKVNESTMLDSEDNYSDGFDFISDDESTKEETDDSTLTGEIEDKVNESNMLDSEDNYSDGFDFVSDDEDADFTIQSNDDAYVGEVEDKVNESTMLDSEDNYDDGFDFLVEETPSEEIPTISSGVTPSFSIHSEEHTTESAGSGLNLDINFGNSSKDDDEDVLVGDVEEKVNQSNLIGNDDDEDDGFNFL